MRKRFFFGLLDGDPVRFGLPERQDGTRSARKLPV
jgi:hypothetical protein